MLNQQTLVGQWDEVRGKIKKKWGKLSDDDVRVFNGNVEQLIGRIQQKTGETREAIEHFLSEMSDEGSETLENVRGKVQQTASQLADGVRQGYEDIREGYGEAERMVQQRPGQAMAVAFGLGLLAGAGVALLLRGHASETKMAHGRAATEQFGRQMLDALAGMLPDSLTKHRG